jgi:hypothetical protein
MRVRALLLFVAVFRLTAEDLAPPNGWAVESQAGVLVFQPKTLRGNEQVRIDLHDSVPPEGSLASWFQSQLGSAAVEDTIRRGCRPKQKENEISCVVSTRGGDHYVYALRTRDGQYRFATILMAPNTLGAMRHLMGIKRILEGAVANAGRAGSPEVAPQTPSPQISAPAPAPAAGSTSPAAIPIEGLYMILRYGFGVGGGMTSYYAPYLLLKDGTVTDDLDYVPLTDADIARWRGRKPRAWGRWARRGSVIAITWNDARRKPETWEKWFNGRPGEPGLPLSGRYRSIGGGGNTALGGDVMVAAWKDMVFSPNGTVVSGGGSGGFSGGQGTGVSVATSSRQAQRQARYRIDGYQIEFTYPDGRRERKWFYLYPDGNSVLGIGDSVFTSGR